MNERLPYEQELAKQLDNLSLPGDDVSWNDMKRRLDGDDDDGIFVPPMWKGCFGYSLLLMFLAIGTWLIITHGKGLWKKNEKEIAAPVEARKNKVTDTLVNGSITVPQKNSMRPSIIDTLQKNSNAISLQNKARVTTGLLQSNPKKGEEKKALNDQYLPVPGYGKDTDTFRNKAQQKKPGNGIVRVNRPGKKKIKKVDGNLISKIVSSSQNADSSEIHDEKKMNKIEASIAISDSANIDSSKKIIDSNVVKKKIKKVGSTAKKSARNPTVKKQMYFSAGIGLHQQLPVNGQKLVPYNSLGRKSTLRDYIPSVYLRMYKDKVWFVQAEFRYGAPQYTREILYAQKKVVDTFTRSTLDTSNRLKKTYYHQLPVSFNYFILPRFSMGLGITWNRFSSAVSEREIKRTNNITQADSLISMSILQRRRADSNFVKSYFQAMIETQYQWKRWSLGARYSFGLEPYIKFQLPGGQRREEKNSSLDVFIRYNLWESRKK